MLSPSKFRALCEKQGTNTEELADHIMRAGLNKTEAVAAINNWKSGNFKAKPDREDLRNLAAALGVEVNDLSEWRSSYRWAPGSPRKARLVTQMISGRPAQEAMDMLRFTHKRAASMINQVLRCAVADADEQAADVDNLYVCEARVDDAGVRLGTKRWIPKDRGRAHPIRKKACHIHVTVTEAS